MPGTLPNKQFCQRVVPPGDYLIRAFSDRLTAVLVIHLLVAALLLGGCNQPLLLESNAPKHVVLLLYGDSRKPLVDGFVEGLGELGYAEGENIKFTFLNAQNDPSQLEPMIQSMLDKDMDVLVACGGLESDAAHAVLQHSDIPVVNAQNSSIVERGLVASRQHPGWNITGVDSLGAEISGKRVELIHDLLPDARRVLILYHDKIAPSRIGYDVAAQTAAKLGMTVVGRTVVTRPEIENAMSSLRPGEVDAMLLVPSAPVDNALEDIILPIAARLNLPIMGHARAQAKQGVFASYGASSRQNGKQAARLADKVLRGVPASSLPFETPKQFELIVNKSAAHTLNIKLPALAESQVNEFI